LLSESEDNPSPVWWVPLLVAGLTPIFATVGTIIAEEIRKKLGR